MRKILLAIIILFFSSCTSIVTIDTPVYVGKELSGVEKLSYNKKLVDENRKVENYKSLIKVKSLQKNAVSIFRQALIYKYPTSLKIETYPTTSFYLINSLDITKAGYKFYDTERKKEYSGKYSKDIIKKFFNIDLELDELADLLLGNIPLEWLKKESFIHVSDIIQVNIDNSYYIELDPVSFDLRKVQKIANNNVLLELNYSKEKFNAEETVSKQIDIVIPEESTLLELYFKSYKTTN